MKTEKGTKYIRIPAYTKQVDGKSVKVPAHVRSTPCPSKCGK